MRTPKAGSDLLVLSDGAALAIVAILALVALAIVILGVGALVLVAQGRRTEATPAVAAPSWPTRLTAARPAAAPPGSRIQGVEIDVPTKHVDALVGALRGAGWSVRETGIVVATDENEEGLTTIAVDVPTPPETPSRQEIQ